MQDGKESDGLYLDNRSLDDSNPIGGCLVSCVMVLIMIVNVAAFLILKKLLF
jgi:hypothetical protein